MSTTFKVCMRVNLDCSYSEKDQVKALGAMWDMARKTWYVVDPDDLTPFIKWIPKEKLRLLSPAPKKSPKTPKIVSGASYAITHSKAKFEDCGCNVLP